MKKKHLVTLTIKKKKQNFVFYPHIKVENGGRIHRDAESNIIAVKYYWGKAIYKRICHHASTRSSLQKPPIVGNTQKKRRE